MKFFSGIISDLTGRSPYYVDDWTAGLDKKVLSATLYIFFLQLFPSVTFAFFLQQRTLSPDGTGSYLGVVETLLSMGLGGLLFALCAGQPLVVVGVTGPIALICAMLYDLALRFNIPFHGWLFWTCLWSCLMHICLAVMNACDAVRYCTAFSGEVFGLLISVIYLYEGVVEFNKGFVDASVTQAAALVALLLGLLHLWTAMSLGSARRWSILTKGVKGFLADYGPSLSIIFYTGIRYIPAFRNIPVPSLSVPPSFTPSMPRSWVPLQAIAETPGWAIGAAILPALVVTGLLFFDHNISSMLSQQPQFGLKKPSSYNWDFALLGLSVLLTGVLGLPPNYGLIPQAPLHVRALAKIKEVKTGTLTTEVWHGVCETRASALGQSVLLLAMLSSPGLAALAAIPKGVLAGLFLHIGISGLQGNSIVDRLYYLVMDGASRAGVHALWAGTTPLRLVASFTGLQVLLVAAIFLVTLTPAGIVFPVLIVLLVPFRLWAMPRLFGLDALVALDPLGVEAGDGGAQRVDGARGREEQAEAAAADKEESSITPAEADSERVEILHGHGNAA